MRFEKAFRKAGLTVMAVVAVLTFVVAAQASESTVAYNLAAGASSSPMASVKNKPVLVMADQTVGGDVGSSEVTVVTSTADGELVWNGFESRGGGLTSGFSPVYGTHIIYIDFEWCVDLEVYNSYSFVVHNACSGTRKGSVTLIW